MKKKGSKYTLEESPYEDGVLIKYKALNKEGDTIVISRQEDYVTMMCHKKQARKIWTQIDPLNSYKCPYKKYYKGGSYKSPYIDHLNNRIGVLK